MVFQTIASGIFQESLLCIRHIHLITAFGCRNFLKFWKDEKIITLPKPDKDPNFPKNLRPIDHLSTTSKLFDKVILKMVGSYNELRDLLNASQSGFRARHSVTLRFMRLTDYVTLSFNNEMSTPR
jgi:hypothetical protein